MGIWIGELSVEGHEGAILFDSVDMVPLSLPLFADEEEAESFLAYAQGAGYADVRRLSPVSLDRLHSQWIAFRKLVAAVERLEDDEPPPTRPMGEVRA